MCIVTASFLLLLLHLFIHSSVDGHSDCFQVLVFVKNVAMNTGVHISVQISIIVFFLLQLKN